MDALKCLCFGLLVILFVDVSNGAVSRKKRWFVNTAPTMTYELTLNVHSGRANPVWMIGPESNNYRQLSTAINGCPSTRLKSNLGYRGYTVKVRNVFGQVAWKTIGRNSYYAVENMMINSNPRLDAAVKTHCREAIAGNASPRNYTIYTEPRPTYFRRYRRKRQAVCMMPPYDADSWNLPPLQSNNNCYNYATNSRTDTFAQPGRGSGQRYDTFSSPAMLAASRRDGLIQVDSTSPTIIPTTGYCLVALVVWPGVDFHWYRLDNNGFWSHKMGQTRARNTDESNNRIRDPRFADRGPYSEFSSFMGVFSGINIQ